MLYVTHYSHSVVNSTPLNKPLGPFWVSVVSQIWAEMDKQLFCSSLRYYDQRYVFK